MDVTKSLMEAEEDVQLAVRQLARQSRRAGPGGKVAKMLDEGGLTNLEVQIAGGKEGRATATGLQVTSDALSMNSEMQVAGGSEGRTTTMDLQATSEAVLMKSAASHEPKGQQSTQEDPALQLARQSR